MKPTVEPPRGELPRIVVSMTVTCVLGAVVLGALFVATDRYQRAATLNTERAAITQMLSLDSAAVVTEIRQFFVPEAREVVYQVAADGEQAEPTELVFALDGRLISRSAAAVTPQEAKARVPLGRLFVARRDGQLAGFVVEGNARGYKNRIRFLVALDREFQVAGVRVVEHEEDPGLGAEVARPWFTGQFVSRRASELATLSVTRDPMPEDWRAVLNELARLPAGSRPQRHAALAERERGRPIYAVTGATISSRALTDGVRATVDHFRRRWALLETELGAES